ncbi:MAG: hypothetical protein ABII22_01580 [Candidatus Micrarchaeota archaeon]
MKFFEIGVHHHDCWFTDAISHFPELQVREISGRTYNTPDSSKRIVKALYKVDSSEPEAFNLFAKHVSNSERVLEVKQIDNRFLQVAWKSSLTSYDAVLNSGCTIISSCYSRDGLETYSAFAEQSGNIKKMLREWMIERLGNNKKLDLDIYSLEIKT